MHSDTGAAMSTQCLHRGVDTADKPDDKARGLCLDMKLYKVRQASFAVSKFINFLIFNSVSTHFNPSQSSPG